VSGLVEAYDVHDLESRPSELRYPPIDSTVEHVVVLDRNECNPQVRLAAGRADS